MNDKTYNYEIIEREEKDSFSVSGFVNDSGLKNPAAVYLLSLGSPVSRKGMKNALMRFAKFAGFDSLDTVPWAQLDVGIFNLFQTYLQNEGKSPNTINTYLAALRGVIKAAWQLEQISDRKKMLFSTVKRVRGSRLMTGRALSQVETAKLIGACNDGASGIRDAALISLGLGCGFRRSELAALRIDAVDFNEQTVKIIGKGNKERLVSAPEIVFIRLQKWLMLRGSEGCPELFVCIGKHGDIRNDHKLSPLAVFKLMENSWKEEGKKPE